MTNTGTAKLIKRSSELVFNFFDSEQLSTVADNPTPFPTFFPASQDTNRDAAASTSESPSNILEKARKQADQMVAHAQQRAADIENAARDKGYQDGLANVSAEVSREVEPMRAKLAQTLSEAASLHTTLVQRLEKDIVRLAMEIAKKVVQRDVAVDPEIVLTLVRVSLERLHDRASARVLLHPDDYDYVVANRNRVSNATAIELVADASISRGGCLVQTGLGDIDARVEKQFAEIERGFMGLQS